MMQALVALVSGPPKVPQKYVSGHAIRHYMIAVCWLERPAGVLHTCNCHLQWLTESGKLVWKHIANCPNPCQVERGLQLQECLFLTCHQPLQVPAVLQASEILEHLQQNSLLLRAWTMFSRMCF